MIVKLLTYGVGVLWIVATIALTIWWRKKFTYVYFGSGSVLNSWAGTIAGASVAAFFLVSIISWPIALLDKYCPYLLDIVVVGMIIRYFMKKKNTAANDNDEEVEDDEGSEKSHGQSEISSNPKSEVKCNEEALKSVVPDGNGKDEVNVKEK